MRPAPKKSSSSRHPAETAAGPGVSWLALAVLVLATLLVFWPTLHNGFISGDDDINILNNPDFRGFTWAHLKWMWTTSLMYHYRPLSWMCLGLVHRIWGLDPFGYHLTSVLLHIIAAVLFYAIARRLLRSSIPDLSEADGPALDASALLAALLFAVHPLRVESVAWASAQEYAVAGIFYLFSIDAYLRAHAAGQESSRSRWLAAALGSFILSLLSFPLAMALPIVFLILDAYPLRRFSEGIRIWFEKIPLLIPILIIAAVDYRAHQHNMLVVAESLAAHCARIGFGLCFYIGKTFWPVHLSPMYEAPAPFDPSARLFISCMASAGLLTLGAIVGRRRWPAAAAAWAYYAVTLAPVLGVSFGWLFLASDRYSYFSCLPWPIFAAAGFLQLWRRAGVWRKSILGLAAGAALAVLMISTWRLSHIWHDSESYNRYILSIEPRCAIAHNNLGLILSDQGKTAEAIAEYRQAIELNPEALGARGNFGQVLGSLYTNLGKALFVQGRTAEAVAAYRKALEIDPEVPEAHNNLGVALASQGQIKEAVAHYRQALKINPDYAQARSNLEAVLGGSSRGGEAASGLVNDGVALARQGRTEEAIALFRQALRVDPRSANAHIDLGVALAAQGKAQESIAEYRQALAIAPDSALAHNNLGFALAGQGRLKEAVVEYRQALKINPDDAQAAYNLREALSRLSPAAAP